jgi:hypothetical protein
VARPQARPSAPRRDPTRRLAALAILAAALLPAGAVEHGPVVCPLRAATGIPCPACGITRSWRAALRGRPADSLRFHPLGLVALGCAAAYAAGLDERLSPGAPRGMADRGRGVGGGLAPAPGLDSPRPAPGRSLSLAGHDGATGQPVTGSPIRSQRR